MLHRALFGSLERFIGILIENYAGKFPFWISPLQTMVIPISEEFNDYAIEICNKIKNVGISSSVDLNLPERLGASYVDKDGTKKIPVMLHRALFGSLERFIGILIENYAGKFPFWISPLQTMVIPISEEFNNYAIEISKKIKNVGISSSVDLKNQNLNYKIRDHSLAKIPLLLICGKKEVDSNSVTIRRLDSNKQENMDIDTFLKTFSALNKASSN
jgi:threonyl-tRNA synthetase